MKSLILFIVSTGLSITTFSQNADDKWTKEGKTDLANECIALLSVKYPDLQKEQRNLVAICYTNSIVTAYPKRSEWLNKMEIEVEKIKSNALEQCIKSNGVEAPVPKVEEKPKPEPVKVDTPKVVTLSKESLSGMWEYEGRKFTFTEGGTYLYEGNNKKCNGQWHLNNKTITLNPASSVSNKFALCGNEEFEIVSFSEKEIDLLKTGAKSLSHFKKIK